MNNEISSINVPWGPRGWPIVGNLLQLGYRPYETLYRWSKLPNYGAIFQLRLGSQAVVVLNSSSIIREALHDHGEAFAGRPYLHMIHETLHGKGVISAPYGREFNEHKNFLIKSFNRFGRRRRSSLENGCLDEVRLVAEKLREKQSSPFGFGNLLSQIACNNICTLTFGRYFETINMNHLFEKINENFNQTATIACFNFLPFTRRFRPNIFNNVHDCNRVIQKLVGERETNFDSEFINNIVDAYLDEMNQHRQRSTYFSKANLDSLVQDLFVAGTETVSNTLNWTIFYIVAHPHIQVNIHEEIDRMIGKDRAPCDKDRSRMSYIEAVLLESMRCHCAGPILLPRATTQDIKFHDYFIPKDTFILVNMWSAMQDEQQWPEPDQFRPERFLDENRCLRNVNHPAMMPFSIGKRACTGMILIRVNLQNII
jgi:cytochrome P450